MSFFDIYYEQIMKYDSINAFTYKDLKKIPKLQTIVLNLGYQKSNFHRLISGLLSLELITSKKSKITRSKNINILLKIKQGNPVGCKITLKKKLMHRFYLKLITSIFIELTDIKPPRKLEQSYKSITIVIKNPLIYIELEKHYEFFKDIPQLDVTFITNSQSENELFYFLKSSKIFL